MSAARKIVEALLNDSILGGVRDWWNRRRDIGTMHKGFMSSLDATARMHSEKAAWKDVPLEEKKQRLLLWRLSEYQERIADGRIMKVSRHGMPDRISQQNGTLYPGETKLSMSSKEKAALAQQLAERDVAQALERDATLENTFAPSNPKSRFIYTQQRV